MVSSFHNCFNMAASIPLTIRVHTDSAVLNVTALGREGINLIPNIQGNHQSTAITSNMKLIDDSYS